MQPEERSMTLLNFASGLIIVYLLGVILITGRSILIPLVIAILIWHFLNAINQGIRLIPKIGSHLPNWVSLLFTIVIVSICGLILFNTISNNVNEVIAASSRYQERFQEIFNQLEQKIHLKSFINIKNFHDDWSFQTIFLAFYNTFTTIMSSAVLIGLYIAFLFVEQHFFNRKMNAFLFYSQHRDLVTNIFKHIVQDTQAYLGLKTFLSFITALACWMIMHAVGLDFSEFWALLIFFLNFIPNIGALIAIIFPMILALVQFQTILPCLIITSGVVIIEFMIGNVIEPRVLSKSLNMSPLVILIALAFWGTVWGILGMFLAVPITVMIMIIFAHFEKTRPIAILLSQDGFIQNSYRKI